MTVTHELQVCTVCRHLIANGEYDDGTDAAQRCAQGMAARWGELAGQIVPGLAEPCDCPPDADCDCEHLGYHTSPCDGCGDSDPGDRFAAVILELVDDPWTPEAARAALLTLADRCDQAATELDGQATDPRAVLAARGYPDATYDEIYADRWSGAAAGARQYAAYLRDLASHGDLPDPDQTVRDADTVTRAAELGGFLTDSSAHFGDTEKTQTCRRLADDGWMQHIAEPGQVAFFQLVPQPD